MDIMVRTCCVYNCANKDDENGDAVSFHRFPTNNPEILKCWISAVRRKNWTPTQHSFICSLHFAEESFSGDGKMQDLKENAVPTLFLISSPTAAPSKKIKMSVQQGCKSDPENNQVISTSQTKGTENSSQKEYDDISDQRLETNETDEEVPVSSDSSIQLVEDGEQSVSDDLSEASTKALVLTLQNGVIDRLDLIEKRLAILTTTCFMLERKAGNVRSLLKNRCDSTFSEEDSLCSLGDLSDSRPTSPIITNENATVCSFGSTEVKLNTKDDFPNGSWLGNENEPAMRVRCCLNPMELAYLNTTCDTPKKMALALVKNFFHFDNPATSDLAAAPTFENRTGLDPLLMYGIQCHLVSMFGINDEAWKELKWIIDSKCSTIVNKRIETTVTTKKPAPNSITNEENGKLRRVGGPLLEFLSSRTRSQDEMPTDNWRPNLL